MARIAPVVAPACPSGLSGGPAARHHPARHEDGRVNCGNRLAEVFSADARGWRGSLASCLSLRNRQATSDEPRAVCWSFRTPHSAFRAPRCFFATSYAQRRTPKSACQKPSNSCQNRSKRRRFPSKSDQKGAHFVMPILTFGGVTPSGASARAVFAFRKGKKARFWRAKTRLEKLSTISAPRRPGVTCCRPRGTPG